MKNKRRYGSVCLVLCLLLSLLPGRVVAEELEKDSLAARSAGASLEEILAGLADPSAYVGGEAGIRKAAASQLIADGTYYLNGQASGDYLKYTTGSISAESGLLASLGSAIQWKIRYTSSGYLISPSSYPNMYLASATDTGSSALQLVTVTATAVPDRCYWSITVAAHGGCLVKNVYSNRYLYSFGDTAATSLTLGTSGSLTYHARVWRIPAITFYGNSASATVRELTSFSIPDFYRLSGGQTIPAAISVAPSKAAWVTAADFTYTGYSYQYFAYDNVTGKLTVSSSMTSTYSATITAIHKVTNRTSTFQVFVNPKAVLVGVPDHRDTSHDHISVLEAVRPTLLGFGYGSAPLYSGSFHNQQILSYLSSKENTMFVSRSHGDWSSAGTWLELYDGLHSVTGETRFFSAWIPSTADFSNMELVLFVGCHTGANADTGLNLPTVAVQRGAKTAVGFQEILPCEYANIWTNAFFDWLNKGKTVQEACSKLAGDYSGTGLDRYLICGDGSTKFTS